MPDCDVEPALIAAWLAARSISRRLPLPVADRGGLRVDTGLPTEMRRYVFTRPNSGLTELGNEIDDPLIFLKLCAPPKVMRDHLPAHWGLDGAGTVMTFDGSIAAPSLPADYRLALSWEDQVICCAVEALDGTAAAMGYAVEHEGVFAFDRIVTDPAHRRRGLGSAVIAGLTTARADPANRFILIATPDGRALYESLGWKARAPYTTARLS